MSFESAFKWAFEQPGRIQQQEWELLFFLSKVRTELKPERTVELGSWRGTTAALLSWVTSDSTISLDKDEYGGKDEASSIARKRLSFHLMDARRQETVEKVMGMLQQRPIDLLFLDDGHRIEEVTDEFAKWSPFVRKGGWIAFHDINPDANQCAPGVHPDICMAHEFWAKLEGNKQEIIFKGNPPGPGIGILIV